MNLCARGTSLRYNLYKSMNREQKIYRVTILGSIVNVLLLAFKFVAGILGHSAAMIADAVHSLSDFLTDLIVLIFVKISSRPQDESHDYGHGKYETLATATIGLALLCVGVMIGKDGVEKIIMVARGGTLSSPGWIAFAAALLSVALKEIVYQITHKVGREVGSAAVEANAWHHRSDALSSIGTAVGIGGAILLGSKWAILDPIAAVIVSVFIAFTALKLLGESLGELLEKSLPKETEDRIRQITLSEPEVSDIHNLRTRKLGNRYAIEMHLRMSGDEPLEKAHAHTVKIEKALRQEFGPETHIMIHLEPIKKK